MEVDRVIDYRSFRDRMSEPRESLSPGKNLGAYRILRVLGGGGMGTVYEAEHLTLKKRVALKALSGQGADDAECRARFLREGKAASRIQHPHVVDITDVREGAGIAFLVMEYLEGESLRARVERCGPVAARDLADLSVPVVAALQVAHQRGVVHRDLKPDNIFLSRTVTGRVVPKVLDFGISKVLNDDPLDAYLTAEHAFLGTPYFMSPEQARGAANVDARSDQYSFGVSLYECATGVNPFLGHTTLIGILQAIASGGYELPRARNPAIPKALEQIILRTMANEPSDRYPSMGALGAELMQLAGPQIVSAWSDYFKDFAEEVPPSSLPAVTTLSAKSRGYQRTLPGVLAVGGASSVVVVALVLTTFGAEADSDGEQVLGAAEAAGSDFSSTRPAIRTGLADPAETKDELLPATTAAHSGFSSSGSAGVVPLPPTPVSREADVNARTPAQQISMPRLQRRAIRSRPAKKLVVKQPSSSRFATIASPEAAGLSVPKTTVTAEPRSPVLETDNINPWQ